MTWPFVHGTTLNMSKGLPRVIVIYAKVQQETMQGNHSRGVRIHIIGSHRHQ
jgi:hypothetical protein